MEPSYSSGKAAKAMRVSAQTIRFLCVSAFIKHERSPGGHLRIAPDELERLKNLDSLPAVPRGTLAAAAGNVTRQAKHELLAPPSVDVVDAAEEAFVSDRQLVTDSTCRTTKSRPQTWQSWAGPEFLPEASVPPSATRFSRSIPTCQFTISGRWLNLWRETTGSSESSASCF